MKTIDVLNHVKNISESESINLINTRLKNTESFISLGFLNQHGFNLLADDTSVQKLFFDLDILLRDGIGIKIANKMSNIENNENLNGTDLIPKVISYLNTDINDFYVFGTEPPWLEEGSLNLLGDEKAAYLIDGFQKLEHYLDFLKQHINTKKNAVIILAMGMPKQEELAFNIKREIKGKGIIICGGHQGLIMA